MKTDEEYIGEVKRSYLKRKSVAIFVMILAIAITVMSYFLYVSVNSIMFDKVSLIIPKHTGTPLTESDIKNTKYAIQLTHEHSLNLGWYIGIVFVNVVLIVFQSINLIFGGRKERMLIKYYEQSKT